MVICFTPVVLLFLAYKYLLTIFGSCSYLDNLPVELPNLVLNEVSPVLAVMEACWNLTTQMICQLLGDMVTVDHTGDVDTDLVALALLKSHIWCHSLAFHTSPIHQGIPHTGNCSHLVHGCMLHTCVDTGNQWKEMQNYTDYESTDIQNINIQMLVQINTKKIHNWNTK